MNEVQTLINIIVDARDAKWQGMLQQAVTDTASRAREQLPPEDEKNAVDDIIDLIKTNLTTISEGANERGINPSLISFLTQLDNMFNAFQQLQYDQEEGTDPVLFSQQTE